MKKYITIFLALLMTLLVACAPLEENQPGMAEDAGHTSTPMPTVEVTSKPTPSPTPAVTAVLTPTPMQMPTPVVVSDGTVPDISVDPECRAYLNDSRYEDEDYIYFLWYLNYDTHLFALGKRDGSITTISSECICFAVHDEKVYYVDKNDGPGLFRESEVIQEYDMKTGEVKPIISVNGFFEGLASYNDRLYYIYNGQFCEDEEERNVLYSADFDGNDIVRIGGNNLSTCCLYKDRIFSMTEGELGFLREYDAEKEDWNTVYDTALDLFFDVGFDKAICVECTESERNISNNSMYDINTGEVTALPFAVYRFVLAGQYIVYYESEDNKIPVTLVAYDYLAGEKYTLLDMSNVVDKGGRLGVDAIGENIYLYLYYQSDVFEMYRVTIKDGNAHIEYVVTIEGIK